MIPYFYNGIESVRNKLNEIVNAVNALQSIRGDETFIAVRSSAFGTTISLNLDQLLARIPKNAAMNTQADGFWAKIGSASLLSGQLARWSYPFVEVDENGWLTDGTSVALVGGISATATNTVEANNSSTGVGTMGSGSIVSSDDYTNSIKEQPIAPGAVVRMYPNVDCNGATVYKFSGWNKKAECPA